jgi:hypothetical protein
LFIEVKINENIDKVLEENFRRIFSQEGLLIYYRRKIDGLKQKNSVTD